MARVRSGASGAFGKTSWMVKGCLEGEVRLLLGAVPGVQVLPRPAHAGTTAVWLSALAAPAPRLVLARHGGLIMPHARLSRPLTGLRCPMFLVH